MADPKQQTDSSDAAGRGSEGNAVSNNGGGLQKVLFQAFLNKQETVRRNVDHAGRLAAVLAVQQEISSGDLDLEGVLRTVTARAVSILGATGSAIALENDRVMVCRATAGATGPGLGAYLAGDSGLTAACLRTGQIMRCNDSDTDPRVDAEAARTLGIRSMVLAPLFYNRATVGVFEVFSAKPHFFEDEDSHVIELLSGLVTTAITYASEFDDKQTLESERTAMLQVLEGIKPAIESILRQPHEAVAPVTNASSEPLAEHPDFSFAAQEDLSERPEPTEEIPQEPVSADSDDWMSAQPAAEPVAHTPTGTERQQPREPVPAPSREPAAEWVPFMLAPHARSRKSKPANYQVKPVPAVPEPPAFSSAPPSVADDEFEAREPEPPPPGFAAVPPASKPPAPPSELPSASKPAKPNPDETQFERLAHAAPSVPPEMVPTLPGTTKAGRQPSPFLSWAASWRAKLRGRGGEHLPAPQTEGAATQAENEFQVSLRWRNVMEYAVPAILTGLLIVIGLQWITDSKLPGPAFNWGAMRTPAPSLGSAPMPSASPVEVSSYVSPEASGLGRTGSTVSSTVKSAIRGSSSEAKDWRPGMPRLGGKIPDLGVTAPVPPAAKDSPAISGIQNIAPSTNSTGSSVTLPSTSAAPPATEPVVVVRLSEKVLDEFLLVRVQPIYPPAARERGLTGTVVLNAVIAPDGTVRQVRSVSGNKYLAESAVSAVSQWRYKPFVLNGKPVEVATELRIAFKKQPWAR